MSSVLFFAIIAIAIAQIPEALPVAIGGAFTQSGTAFGFTTSGNSGTSATSAATGGLINTATIVNAPSTTNAPTVQSLNRYVPDYRNSDTTTTSNPPTTATKRHIKVSNTPKSPSNHQNVCWRISKTCCYQPFQKGYRCKDYYVYKYTRCHPIVEYKQICGEITEHPSEHRKPVERVLYEESVIKNYDCRYGPHVEGYPATGESDFYDTAVIPQRPHGVTAVPYDPHVQRNQQNGNAGQNSSGAYHGTSPSVSNGNGYQTLAPTRGYTAKPTTSGKGYTPSSDQTTSNRTGNLSSKPDCEQAQPRVAAVHTHVQSGGTYRFVEPAQEVLR